MKLDTELNSKFVRLIAAKTGLKIREQSQEDLQDTIFNRCQQLKLKTPQAYYQLLASPTEKSKAEWEQLVPALTNLESYFFRDRGQFQLIKETIFPNLIKRHQVDRTLRICSAGCSTGEEPYSLAITLRELIRDWSNWRITILGVDINSIALEKAQAGIYNQWSFRRVEEQTKQRYFKSSGNQFQLSPIIRDLVTFKQVNLYQDHFPTKESPLQEMDLILCRNVFIYFDPKVVNQIINKFYSVLQPEGYLITGHAELSGLDLSQFQTQIFPESLVYQRPLKGETPTVTPKIVSQQIYSPPPLPVIKKPQPTPPVTNVPKKENSPQPTKESLLNEAEIAYKEKDYDRATSKLKALLKQSPSEFAAHYLLAQIHANLGKYEEAKQSCQEALAREEFSIEPYYILAKIAEEEQDLNQAKQLYKRIIYLEPNAFIAYLELSHLYEITGDQPRQEKMKNTAIQLLQKLPAEQTLSQFNNLTVAELLQEFTTEG